VSEEREQVSGEVERRRLLFFRSGGELFTMDIASVAEIVVDGHITPVPLAPREVAGVINRRGRIFTVIGFAALAGLADEETGGAGEAAVLLHRSDMSVGVVVEAIEGIEWVPRNLLDAATSSGREREESFLGKVIDFRGRVAGLVDLEGLVGAIVRLPDSGATRDQRSGSERREVYGS
jgi:purine-binding chemotaxis protein CheW